MKRVFCSLSLIFFIVYSLLAQVNSNHVWVNGYYRSDGTYVNGYYRTAPNNTNRDNFSTKGNVNPYTGKPGWIEPDNNSFEVKSYSHNYRDVETEPISERSLSTSYSYNWMTMFINDLEDELISHKSSFAEEISLKKDYNQNSWIYIIDKTINGYRHDENVVLIKLSKKVFEIFCNAYVEENIFHTAQDFIQDMKKDKIMGIKYITKNHVHTYDWQKLAPPIRELQNW